MRATRQSPCRQAGLRRVIPHTPYRVMPHLMRHPGGVWSGQVPVSLREVLHMVKGDEAIPSAARSFSPRENHPVLSSHLYQHTLFPALIEWSVG
jgi:hypothetical protein